VAVDFFGQNCFGFIPLNPDAVTPLPFSFYFPFLFSFSLFLLLISFCPSPFFCRTADRVRENRSVRKRELIRDSVREMQKLEEKEEEEYEFSAEIKKEEVKAS
jgi:hypothetical protein